MDTLTACDRYGHDPDPLRLSLVTWLAPCTRCGLTVFYRLPHQDRMDEPDLCREWDEGGEG